MKTRHGKVYEGSFKNDTYDGFGKLTLLNKRIRFEGNFQEGMSSDYGKIIYYDKNEEYEG